MLRTKSIFKPAEESDGLRISVMSRHTTSDGRTPDPRLIPGVFDMHLVELAPPPKLVGSWYRKEIDWTRFTHTYMEHLDKREPSETLRSIAAIALSDNVTLLCAEETPENCHRAILADKMRFAEPLLRVEHL